MRYISAVGAILGSLLSWFGAAEFIWHIVSYGIIWSGHFRAVQGWGGAFVYSLQIIMLGSTIFLLSIRGVTRNRTVLPRAIQPKILWTSFCMSILLFCFALIAENLLVKHCP